MGSESLEDYVRRIGKLITQIHERLGKVEARLDALSEEVEILKASVAASKTEVSSLGGSMVLKADFDDFVKRLTDSFKEILPPAPEQTGEASQQ